jgi:hypothetical protein
MFNNEICAGHKRNPRVVVVPVTAATAAAAVAAHSIAYHYVYIQSIYMFLWGHTVVEAPRYKPDGRRFDSRWCHWNFF